MTRHRTAQRIVEEVGTGGPEPASLLTDLDRHRMREIGKVVAPERFDVEFLLNLLDRLERQDVPERDRRNYERGRIDERIYWRTKQQLAGEPLKLASHTPLVFIRSRSRGWEVTAPLSWVVTLLVTLVLVVGVILTVVP